MPLISNIENKFKVCIFSIVSVCIVCSVFCTGCLIWAYKVHNQAQQRIYLMAPNGTPLIAERSDKDVSLGIEAQSQLNIFHNYFFTFSPSESELQKSFNYAAALCSDNSVSRFISRMKAENFYNNIQSFNMMSNLSTDSCRVDKEGYFQFYGTMRVQGRSTYSIYKIKTTGYLQKRLPRIPENPHALYIYRWSVGEIKIEKMNVPL